MKRILAIVLVVSFFLVSLTVWFDRNRPTLAREEDNRRAVPVQRGDIIDTVKATGKLEPRREVSLRFDVEGTVSEVLVKRGEAVKAGQPLVRLDTADWDLAVDQAKLELEQAQTELAQVTADVDPDDLASARAALASAQAKYDALLAGSSEDEITVAAADLRKAEVALQQAQGDYDRVSYKGGVGASAEAAALQEATIEYAKALANYNLAVKEADDEELRAAEAEIASAQAALNNLLQGATEEEIALAEAKVRAAELSLEKAYRDLDKATLTAPIDGTVAEINVEAGERTGSDVAVVLLDLSTMHIDVEIDEIDVPSVRIGQPVEIRLDAMPDQALSGTVTDIAPAPIASDSGLVSYEVTITLGDSGAAGRARIGMTASSEIETERRANVLVIPSTLIQIDEATGETYVEKRGASGEAIRTAVTLGKRSGQMVEVLSGLADGDQVLVPEAVPLGTSNTNTESASGARFPGMGGGMVIRGGGPPPGGGPP